MRNAHRRRASRSCLVLPACALVACVEAGPAQPSFQDVMPILAANCVRCHASPPIGGAPSACTTGADGVRWCGFRLDSYDDLVVDEGDPSDPSDDVGVRGAAWVSAIIPARVSDPRSPMPPRFPLGDREQETLSAWARGEPPDRRARPGNEPPVIALDVVAPAGAVRVVRYAVGDADGDLVVGQLRARDGDGRERVIAPIQSGRDEVAWDTSGVAAGSYTLVARLDDGGGWIALDAGTIDVMPGVAP